jgi:hypothetical protein
MGCLPWVLPPLKMDHMGRHRRNQFLEYASIKHRIFAMKQTIIASALLILLSACSRDEPTTYEVPKESPAPAPRQSMSAGDGMMGSQSDNELVEAAHASMSAMAPDVGYTADLPEGWTEKGGSGMRMASYSIEGTSIDFYLISLTMGDVPSNVNRWRGQVDLPAASPEEIASEVQTFEVDGHAVSYIEIYNEEGGKGIVAAIVDLEPKYWYFTAKGSVDELKAHAGELRAFLESLQIK